MPSSVYAAVANQRRCCVSKANAATCTGPFAYNDVEPELPPPHAARVVRIANTDVDRRSFIQLPCARYDSRTGGRTPGAASREPVLVYMFGQLWLLDPDDPCAPVPFPAFVLGVVVVGLLPLPLPVVAAYAVAAPPTTRAPAIVAAVTALRIGLMQSPPLGVECS